MRASSLLFLLFLFSAADLLSQNSGTEEAPSPVTVYIDDSQTPLTGPEVTVPYDSSKVRFQINPTQGRIRYQLEGVDKDWRQRDGVMYFGVRFFTGKGNLVGQVAFPSEGKSAGWNKSLEHSTFTLRREKFVVPPQAEYLTVLMSSAGPPDSVGAFAISEITLKRPTPGKGDGEVILKNPPFAQSGDKLNPPFYKWFAAGTHPSMAQIKNLPGPKGNFQVLAILDDDVNAHADWATADPGGPKVVPGETLTLQWMEAYNNSLGRDFSTGYGRLPSGSYRFKVEESSLFEASPVSEYSITVRVPLPYWKSPWIWGIGFCLLSIVVFMIGRNYMRADFNRELEHVRLIQDERMRIARDLHDDLGARLSQISLTSSHAEDSTSLHEAHESLREITDLAQEIIASLSETVWMLNNRNDHLSSLVDYLCRSVDTICRAAGVSCRIEAEAVSEHISISSDVRHQICLCVKEALINSLKHSGASEIRFKIRYQTEILKISILDNGKGIAQGPKNSSFGNGLVNMRQRMSAIEGNFLMEPAGDSGTHIQFTVPLV